LSYNKFTLESQRVYYEDTDAMGIMYHASYLKYMDRARCECLWSMGICFDNTSENSGVFVVSDIKIKYFKSLRLQDTVNISCDAIKLGSTYVVFEQKLSHQQQPDQVYSAAEVRVVSIDKNGRPALLPEKFRNNLLK
jgi:acyl-CoA thioester hydrolase